MVQGLHYLNTLSIPLKDFSMGVKFDREKVRSKIKADYALISAKILQNLYITDNDKKGEIVDVDSCLRLGALATTLRYMVIERSVIQSLGLAYTGYFTPSVVDSLR